MDEYVWQWLYQRIGNPCGVAGIMGNLYAESAMNPRNLQNTFERKLNLTDDSYTEFTDAGLYENFVYDGAGYGLAQWTFWTRKKGLLECARRIGKSVGDVDAQLEFLWAELQGYPGVLETLRNAASVREASDAFMLKYERPGDTSELSRQKRARFGEQYLERFGGEKMAVNYDKYINSAGTHYISNSGSDENKQYKGGQAGDQTGHEWELKAWYNRPWSCVLRHPKQVVAETIAKLSIAAALNDKIGYDQNQRGTYWTQLQKVNYDPSAIKTACEEDCTAGVSANVKAAGWLCGIKELQNLPLCTSRNMRAKFTAAGFAALTDSKYLKGTSYLLPGDILLYENHHAAANVTLGAKMKDWWFPQDATKPSESDPETEKWTGPTVTITGASVNLRPFPGTEKAPLGTVKKGAKLPLYGVSLDEGWYFVDCGSTGGWVSGKYAEVDEDVDNGSCDSGDVLDNGDGLGGDTNADSDIDV